MGLSWAVLAHLGAAFGPNLGLSAGRLGAILRFGLGNRGLLGLSWGRLGAVLRRLGDVLGRISLPIQLESDF